MAGAVMQPNLIEEAKAVFEELSKEGTRIRLKHNPARLGSSLGQVLEEDGDTLVRVRFDGAGTSWELVQDLELADAPVDEEALIAEGRFARTSLLRRTLTSVQLSGDLSELIYSMDMTNTEFMPHQFKPLLALLESPSRGVLIADEVGLGKTIEAGLIWTELRFRADATTMLVVCPAMLTEKWRLELARRFGTPSQVMGAAELLQWLETPRHQQVASAIICSIQGLRPTRGWDNQEEPSMAPPARLARKLRELEDASLFDLTVIDEAHYLRNEDTSSAELGRLLRPVSEHLILLSATPINTRSDDLFNLVTLVDPQQFQFRQQFTEVLEANRPLVSAANRLKHPDCQAGEVHELLESAAVSWLLAKSGGLKALRDDLAARPMDEVLSPSTRADLSERIQRVNLLGQSVVRSRKVEVFVNRVVRRVHYVEVPMTTAERELYTAVTEAIIRYAMGHAGVEGFLLAMPQQLMSSCMFAAASRWGAGIIDEPEDEEFAYESLGEVDLEKVRPVTQYVEDALRGTVDLAALRGSDSKFEHLLDIIKKQIAQSPEDKILVFSFFRETLSYLKSRLEAEGFPSVIVRGGDDKQALIDQFKDDPVKRVLLASEVAAEGVDLQFMRVMVNYDLPWNPMRIEQRIGRIDRIGQKADAISIFNLTYADTIDARILVRLFARLRLFEESLGSTEEVIGSEISQLTNELLSAQLTEVEQERRIEKARYAIEQRRRDLAQVESSEADLVGLGDFVRDRVMEAHTRRRTISDADILAHIEEYLNSSAPGFQLHLDPGPELLGQLMLPASLAVKLRQFREGKNLPRSRLESGHLEKICIRNHVDSNVAGRYELINQFHPLVRLIASDKPEKVAAAIHAVRIQRPENLSGIPVGSYAFRAEWWRFSGLRQEAMLRGAFISLDNGSQLPQEYSFDLLNAMRAAGTDWVQATEQLPAATKSLEAMESAGRRLAAAFRVERERHEVENQDRARLQLDSITRNRDRRRATFEAQIAAHRSLNRRGLEQADRARMERMLTAAEVQLERVRTRQAVVPTREPLADGVVRIEP